MKEFLLPEERAALRLHHRKEKDGRTRDRIKAVLLSDKGWTYKAIAEALLLDEETISKHIELYKSEKQLEIQSGGKASKLNSEQTQELSQHLEEKTYLTTNDICQYIQDKYNIQYTIPGMTSWLKKHDFSYKKPKGTPAKADPAEQQKFIEAYNELLKTLPENEPILFGDGVHPTMATKISYGWIKKGTDKLIPTTASRTRMNLMGALNLETMDVTIAEYDTIDSVAMDNFFQRLSIEYSTAAKIHLILDQGPYNISLQTQESAKKYGIDLHFLPPYSPNLNPIERLWKVMNEYVRNNRFFKSTKEFANEIMNFFKVTWFEIRHSLIDRLNDNFQIINP
jgi:transposase